MVYNEDVVADISQRKRQEIIDIVEHTHLSIPLICNETGKGQLWGTPGATNLNSELGAEESQQAPTFVDVNAARRNRRECSKPLMQSCISKVIRPKIYIPTTDAFYPWWQAA